MSTPGNDQLVGMTTDGIVSIALPKVVMAQQEALRHAAWIVAVADPPGDEFAGVLSAVLSGSDYPEPE